MMYDEHTTFEQDVFSCWGGGTPASRAPAAPLLATTPLCLAAHLLCLLLLCILLYDLLYYVYMLHVDCYCLCAWPRILRRGPWDGLGPGTYALHACTYINVCMHVRTHVCACVCSLCVCCKCVCVCVCVCICLCICIGVWTRVCSKCCRCSRCRRCSGRSGV